LTELYTRRVASISQFLVDLAENPELRREFAREKKAVMTRYTLTQGQQAIILSGDLERIRNAIDYEYATGAGESLPGYGMPGEVAMLVTWQPVIPTWCPPPPPPPEEDYPTESA
jgi:Aromatic-ring-opening dioxygenase LigAB, LigA subunit